MATNWRSSQSTEDVPLTNVVDLRRPAAPAPSSRRTWWRRSSPRPKTATVSQPPVQVVPPPVTAAAPKHARPTARAPWRWHWSWRSSSFPVLAIIVLLPVIAVSIFQPVRAWAERVEQPSQTGLTAFREAGVALQAFDLPTAEKAFAEAHAAFTTATHEYQTLGGWGRSLVVLWPGTRSKYHDGERILQAGAQLAQAGQRLSQALAPLHQPNPTTASFAGPEFVQAATAIEQSLAEVQSALHSINQVNPKNVPAAYRQRFATLIRLAPELESRLAALRSAVPFIHQLLGGVEAQEYLFLFQNNAELRPGGGFIGSLALVKFDQGEYKILDAPGRGPFAINDFFPKVLVPPQPVQVIAPYWALHDANWFVDFPTSAKKVAWFYEQARGFPIDGVVAMTPTLVERLLLVTGPLALPSYDTVVTAETFRRITQDIVEHKYDKAVNQPKQFVIDLIPALLEKVAQVPAGELLTMLLALDQSIVEKDLLVWSAHEEQQARAVSLGWAGELPSTTADQLTVVEANLGGGKTSQVLEREAELVVEPTREGLDHTLTMTFHHKGTIGDPFTGPRYRGFFKFYVPTGSELIDASGFDPIPTQDFLSVSAEAEPDADLRAVETRPVLDEQTSVRQTDEFGRRAFGGWLVLPTGESQTITLRYRTVHTEISGKSTTYELQVNKQPGAITFPLVVRLRNGGKLHYSSPTATQQDDTVSTTLTINQTSRWITVWAKNWGVAH